MFPRSLAAFITLLAMTIVGSSGPARADAPGDDLPDGQGKKILLRACTTCHGLDEVVKFKGYYTRDQWRDIVVTMREYGAELAEGEAESLAQYLADALGKKD